MEAIQNGIEEVLKSNPLIPVATIERLEQVDEFYQQLKSQGVFCIEITLRTEIAWEAIALFKKKYSSEFKVGVGTVVSANDVFACMEHKVDFIVCPGLTNSLVQPLESSNIPFIPGVCTPSEIMRGLNLGWNFFKFFPADLYGGVKALKTYGGVFSKAKFCPTGGIGAENHKSFLELENVLSVGGSWLTK